MIISDSVLKVVKDYRLPIGRNQNSIKLFLRDYFDSYIHSLRNALGVKVHRVMRNEFYDLLENSIEMIENLSDGIIEILETFDSADMIRTYEKLDETLTAVKDFLYLKDFGISYYVPDFYRIRSGNQSYSRQDLFHIPFTKRKYIKPYRYSIAGYPCLYISDSIELCWFECGMPNEFSVSKFRYQMDEERRFQLIDFSKNPIDVVTSVPIWYHNHPEDKEKIDNYVIKYLITHPLRASCSIKVQDRNVPFIEEYIIPQLLLLWIRQNEYFDGVAYSSSSAIDAAHDWNSFNVVLPAKKINTDFCEVLSSMFKISKPEIVLLSRLVEKYDENILSTREFLNDLEYRYFNGKAYYLFREIISLCKSFLFVMENLKSGKTNDPELLYQMMDTLNLQAYVLADNKTLLEEKVIEKAKSYYQLIEYDEVLKEYYDIINRFEKDIKPILFEFWSYAGKISCETKIDEESFKTLHFH